MFSFKKANGRLTFAVCRERDVNSNFFADALQNWKKKQTDKQTNKNSRARCLRPFTSKYQTRLQTIKVNNYKARSEGPYKKSPYDSFRVNWTRKARLYSRYPSVPISTDPKPIFPRSSTVHFTCRKGPWIVLQSAISRARFSPTPWSFLSSLMLPLLRTDKISLSVGKIITNVTAKFLTDFFLFLQCVGFAFTIPQPPSKAECRT